MEDETVNTFSSKRAEKDERDSFLQDVEAGAEPEWEAVVVPEWKNRTVWVRSLTAGERAKWRRQGYRTRRDETGESIIEETGEAEPLLIQMSVYLELSNGQRKQAFPQDAAGRDLIKRQRGGGANDRLVEVALRISGLTKKKEDEAAEDFLLSPTNTDDSDSPETSE
jgi:hypothetical protein